MTDLFSVQGKVALVTGGTSGIGLMVARGLVERGATVYIVARDVQACRETTAELSKRGVCRAVPGDLSTMDGIEAAVGELKSQEPALHVLVNNAGIMYEAPIEEFAEEGWDNVIDLNLKSVFFLTQRLLPLLRMAATPAEPASVINIGSVGGLRVGPKPNYSYQAAKAGLHHLTSSLAKRLGPEHITVNAIAPGAFPSRLTQIPEAMLAGVEAVIPRRRVGEANDITGAVLYFASRAGAYTTGTILPVDGGLSL